MTAPVTIMDEHERALDYLYGLLDAEEKARFEAHLATCARCQAELEANGRVRAAAKSVLPFVEPSERLSGALHAQLMHEAAQRASRGRVLPFVRRLVRHPAYAAAAGLLIVGGAVGLQWSRGRLTMPPPAAHEETIAPAASPPPPVAAATPAAQPADEKKPAPLEKNAPVLSPEPALSVIMAKPMKAVHATKDEASLDDMMLERATNGLKGGLVGGAATPSVSKKLATRNDLDALDGLAAKDDSSNGYGADKQRVYKERGREEPEAAPSVVAQNAPVSNGPPPAPAPKSASVMPAQNVAPAPEGGADRNDANRPSATQAYGSMRAGSTTNDDTDRRQAATFAQQGRCDEAASLYGAIDRRAPQSLTSTDRLAYAHCLRVLGRVDPAQNELDQLANTRSPPRAVAAEQQALNSERRKQNAVRPKAKRSMELDNQASPPPAAAKPSL